MAEDLSVEIDMSPNTWAGVDDGTRSFDQNSLIETIWKECHGRIEREQIRQAILKAEAKYQTATIKTFIPIFIRRDVLEELR